MANVVLPILAAIAGFAGTMFVVSRERPLSNPQIREGWAKGFWEPGGGAWEYYMELYDKAVTDVWFGAKEAGPDDRYPWEPIPLSRMRKIWKQYTDSGEVLDEKGLDSIGQNLVEKIATLDAMTDLAGHGEIHPKEILERVEEEYDEETDEKLGDYILDEHGSWRISDSALNAGLRTLAMLIIESSNAEEKLQFVDRILNVVHPRSDMARWFVEGGREGLDVLFEG